MLEVRKEAWEGWEQGSDLLKPENLVPGEGCRWPAEPEAGVPGSVKRCEIKGERHCKEEGCCLRVF